MSRPRTLSVRTVVTACLAGVLLRALVVSLVAYRFDTGDAATYDLLGKNLLEHGVLSVEPAPPFLPTVYRGPGFPGFLAAVYAVFGHSYVAVQAFHVLFGIATVAVLALAVERVRPSLAPLTLWAGMLCPFDAVYQGALLTEALCTLFLTLGLCLPLLLSGWWRWLLAGAALAMAALTREVYLLLIPFAGLVFALSPTLRGERIDVRGSLVAFACLGLSSAAVIAPWTIRNYHVTQKIIPLTQGGAGAGLWMGSWAIDDSFSHSDATGKRVWPKEAFLHDDDRAKVEAVYASHDFAARDRLLVGLFKERFRHEPLRVLGRWFVRAPRLWLGTRFEIFSFRPAFLDRGRPAWYLLKAGLWGLNAAIVALGFVGLLVSMKRREADLLWFSTLVVYTLLVYLPFNSFEPRYSQPAYPFLMVFACSLTEMLVRRAKTPRSEPEPRDASAEPELVVNARTAE